MKTPPQALCVGLILFSGAAAALAQNPADPNELRPRDKSLIDKFEIRRARELAGNTFPEYLPVPSAIEKSILKRLEEKTEVSFTDNPLDECLKFLSEFHHVQIWADPSQAPGDLTVSLQASHISLRSCLNLILPPLGLCYVVEDDVLKVTSSTAAAEKRITRSYPISDLIESPDDIPELLQVLYCGLAHSADAPETQVLANRSTVIVRQSHQVHDQVRQLMCDLRESRHMKTGHLPEPSDVEQKILDALNNPTDVVFRDIDLQDALNFLKEQHGIQVWLDRTRLAEQDVKVTLELTKVSLRSCLNLLLEPHGLCSYVEDDVLKVTTKAFAASTFVTRVYPIRDLLDSGEDDGALQLLLTRSLGLHTDPELPANLRVSSKYQSVILNQSYLVHDQLEQLLRDLRKTRESERDRNLVLLVLTLKNPDGTRNDTPYVLCGDALLTMDNVQQGLAREVQRIVNASGKEAVRQTSIVIRAQSGIPNSAITSLIKECNAAGFVIVKVQPIQATNSNPTDGSKKAE